MSLDRGFRVELEPMQNNAAVALKTIVRQTISETMPSETKAVTAGECSSALNILRQSTTGRMCGHAPHAQIECVVESANNLIRGIAPSADKGMHGGFYDKVMLLLPCFQRAVLKLEKDGQMCEEKLVGSRALRHSFQLMTDRVRSSPESVKLFELEVFPELQVASHSTREGYLS